MYVGLRKSEKVVLKSQIIELLYVFYVHRPGVT